MDNRPKTQKVKLESFIQGLELSLSFLQFITAAVESLHSHLVALRDMRKAVRAGATPLSWEEMCLQVQSRDPHLADCLERVTVKAATLGRVWVQCSKSKDWAYLSFAKEELKNILSEAYGVDFKIRLQLTNDAAEDVLEAYREG
jgi:hypothetical protein